MSIPINAPHHTGVTAADRGHARAGAHARGDRGGAMLPPVQARVVRVVKKKKIHI